MQQTVDLQLNASDAALVASGPKTAAKSKKILQKHRNWVDPAQGQRHIAGCARPRAGGSPDSGVADANRWLPPLFVSIYTLGVVFGPRIVVLPIVERLTLAHWRLFAAAPLGVAATIYDAFEKQVPPGWRHEAAGMVFQINGLQKFFTATPAIASPVILVPAIASRLRLGRHPGSG